MKKLLFILLALYFFNLSAQSSLIGKITGVDGNPLVSVNITLISSTEAYNTVSDIEGNYVFKSILPSSYILKATEVNHENYVVKDIVISNRKTKHHNIRLVPLHLEDAFVLNAPPPEISMIKEESISEVTATSYTISAKKTTYKAYAPNYKSPDWAIIPDNSTEKIDTGFVSTEMENTSTFSIDVDNASYTLLRNSLLNGIMPESESIRIEEMINYFSYNYPSPKANDPFSINTEFTDCPWNENANILQIGLQGKKVDYQNLQNSNLVFLLDVSGSMSDDLVLVKESLKKLINNLSEKDRVAIVVYAGAAGMILPSTSATEKNKIVSALDGLSAGGSTAGGAGINLAYKIAKENFIPNGNNRVILCTDGDFNVGVSSGAELEDLIIEKKQDDIFLTICGFGGANYQDAKMEQMADIGNGNYYYIDQLKEAEKVFVTNMRGTLFTIAKDVKIQIEFDSDVVQSYRLIGYKNRVLENKDFEDDKKDAGELGAGHSVTALYEVILNKNVAKEELAEIRLRYKKPKGSQSKLITQDVQNKPTILKNASADVRFSILVASFGVLLSQEKTDIQININNLISQGKSINIGKQEELRKEFLSLLNSYKVISN